METTDIDANSTTETFSDCKPAFDLKSLMRPDYKIKEIKTPLVIAAEKGSIEVAKLLLANENIDVNKAEQCYSQETQMHNRDGKYPLFYSCNSPLTIAIEKGYIEIAKLLLSHPQIDVNFNHKIEDNDNDNIDVKSALILAIENEELDIVKLLLANPKIDVNARSIKKKAYEKDYDEKTPLYFAIQKGNIEITKEILKSNDFDINSSQLIKVSYPYEEGNDPTTKTLISALNLATEQSNLDIVNLLLSHPKISLNEQSTKCLKYMSKMSSFVEYKMGGGWSYIMPLINKVMNNPGNDFKLLETVNYPALCFAISHKEFDIAKAILSSEQCDVNAEMTRSSHTIEEKEWSALAETKIPALCFAIDSNNIEIVKLLLSSSKINVNADYVSEHYYYNSGAEEEEEEEEDKNEKEIGWILERKINPPLSLAVKKSNKEIIKLLLQNKEIDLNKIDDQNKKAIDYADDEEIKKIFQEFK